MMRSITSWYGAAFAAGVAATLAVALPGPATAQVPFQILRPQEGATVRETVNIQLARPGLPRDGYVQLTVDNRFKAAYAVPTTDSGSNDQMKWDKDAVTLLWDTKAVDLDPRLKDNERTVRDGTHAISVVAMDRGNRKVGEQKVTVSVANTLPTPEEGVPLVYQFKVGDTSVFSLQSQLDYTSSPAQQGLNFGRPTYNPQTSGMSDPSMSPDMRPRPTGPVTVTVQTVEARAVRTTEDVVGGNNFFIRDKVTGGTIQGAAGQGGLLEGVYQLKSRYRTVSNTGSIVSYGSLSSTKPGAYVALPIIDLGGGRRRVGQTWSTRTPIYLEWATLDPPPMIETQNTLEALEWQDGYQTARIRQTARGRVALPIFGGAGKMENAQVDLTRIVWFGYMAGKIVRVETVVNADGEAPSNILQSMVGGTGGGPEGGSGEMLSGDPEAMPGAMPGMMGGGSPFSPGSFGAVQQVQEAAKVPAKFRSVQTMSLQPDAKE